MLINGDAAAIPLRDESVHTICTSPPYWSLRRYSGEQERDWPAISYAPMPGLAEITVPAMRCALGLEPTPEAYVGHMVLVGRELWRVLRDDGVWWLNMGDSYARQAGDDATRGMPNTGQARVFLKGLGREGMGNNRPPANLKAGDLLMVPHRLALALQGDGWTVRNDCVWHKVAPMPESVSGWRWERHRVKISGRWARGLDRETAFAGDGHSGDIRNKAQPIYKPCPGCDKCEAAGGYVLRRGSWRHTRAHEFVLMITKGMGYFSNQEAVREGNHIVVRKAGKDGDGSGQDGRRALGFENNDTVTVGRNPHSVLSPSPENYSGRHFAVFPTSLIAPLIRATTPARCCPTCGEGWAAVVERGDIIQMRWTPGGESEKAYAAKGKHGNSSLIYTGGIAETNILGYRFTCDCPPHDPVPGVVFDPFIGSGTTARVAKELGLRWIGADLSFEYLDLQAKVRTKSGAPSNALDDLPLFALSRPDGGAVDAGD